LGRNDSARRAAFAVIVSLSLPALPAAAAGRHPKLQGNNFFSNCRFSHVAPDDPIVYPRAPGRSHSHTFFGNTSTDASSTVASLRAAGTTCSVKADKAAYWVPTLFQRGREVRPAKAQVYYVLRGYDQMSPFPAGLRMVAGWPFEQFRQVTGHDLRREWAGEMQQLVQRGWGRTVADGFQLTSQGLRFADAAAELFLRS